VYTTNTPVIQSIDAVIAFRLLVFLFGVTVPPNSLDIMGNTPAAAKTSLALTKTSSAAYSGQQRIQQ
jgi:hypothetical protein